MEGEIGNQQRSVIPCTNASKYKIRYGKEDVVKAKKGLSVFCVSLAAVTCSSTWFSCAATLCLEGIHVASCTMILHSILPRLAEISTSSD